MTLTWTYEGVKHWLILVPSTREDLLADPYPVPPEGSAEDVCLSCHPDPRTLPDYLMIPGTDLRVRVGARMLRKMNTALARHIAGAVLEGFSLYNELTGRRVSAVALSSVPSWYVTYEDHSLGRRYHLRDPGSGAHLTLR